MKLEGKIKHGIALAIDHNDYVDCDVVYYGGMTIRLVNASYDDLSIAFGPVGSYVDMNAYYTRAEIDDKGYLTEHQDISGKADKVDTYTKTETNTLLDAKANASTTYTKSEVDTLISNVDIDIDDVPTSGSDHAVSSGGVYDSLENKQNTLVSGTNIKTINGVSVLGSGDIDADDVVVGKLENDKFYTVTISGLGTKTFSSTPVTGNYNKLYADILTFKLYWYDPKIIQFGSDDVHYKLIGGGDETDPIFMASVAHGITSADIAKWDSKVDSSDLASVATSGSYNDLSNKPTIPTVPTNVSAFTNDAGYLTQHQSLANYYTKGEVNSAIVDSNPVIEDTRSALAPKITGVASFSTLVDKQRVTIHLAHGPGNSTTLELTLSDGVTTTGAIPVYARTYSGGLGQIADGHFRAGTYMELIYNSTQNRWYCLNLDRDTTAWQMSQSEINNSTNSDPRSVPTAKLLRDNFYTKSEINATIGDIETLLASI